MLSAACGSSSPNNSHRRLWVPAVAGTTAEKLPPVARRHRLDQLAAKHRIAAGLAGRRAAWGFDCDCVGGILRDRRIVGGERRALGKIPLADHAERARRAEPVGDHPKLETLS